MVSKGVTIFLKMWAIQRDPNFWKDTLEFKPQRFLDDNGKFDHTGNNFNFLPFGSGRRVRAGLPLVD